MSYLGDLLDFQFNRLNLIVTPFMIFYDFIIEKTEKKKFQQKTKKWNLLRAMIQQIEARTNLEWIKSKLLYVWSFLIKI